MAAKDQDVLQLLDSLDAAPIAQPKPTSKAKPTNAGAAEGKPGDAAEALAFLDELTQKSSKPTRVLTPGPRVRNATDTVRKSVDSVRGAPSASATPPRSSTPSSAAAANVSSSNNTANNAPSGGWGFGWGSVGNVLGAAQAMATQAAAQARVVVEEQAKNLPNNEQAQKWREGMIDYVKNAKLDKLGQDLRNVGLTTFTEIINAVAPPIAEHEVIQIWLSHDMKGYEGVESLAYRALARIMEQVEGGDLVVNRGDESRPAEISQDRDIGAIEGLEAALKLAIADLDQLMKSEHVKAKLEKQEASVAQKESNPTVHSNVFLRVQPFLSAPLPIPVVPGLSSEKELEAPPQQLQFLLYLVDTKHGIAHTTVTQHIPSTWLDIWDDYDWVEDLVVDALRVGFEIIGEQYLVSRMGWGKKTISPAETPAAPAEEKKEKQDD